ncbi:MAG: outer membrane beta-barrel protein [Candidatus Egerieousia sp.]
MKRLLYRILFLTIICATSLSSFAQIADTVDIMKEYNEHSFSDARNIKAVKDSTKLTEHLIGVKLGYSLNNITFSQDIDTKALSSFKNFGLYYTYYHNLWNQITLFGLETGFQYNEEGYKSIVYTNEDKTEWIEGKETVQEITLPLVSQFRVDINRVRILLNAGCFASYKISTSFSDNISPEIADTYRKAGYGFILGGGLAYIFRPFEIHIEANYKYNFSNLFSQKAFYEDIWVSNHTTQLIFTAGLFYRIGGSGYKNPANAPRRNKKVKSSDIEYSK